MTKIIAEIGVNHNGNVDTAIRLVKLAKLAGVDYVKFQIFNTELLVTNYAKKSKYQIKNKKDKTNQFKMLKNLELSKNDHKKIHKYCRKLKINYCASPFDLESLKFLLSLKTKIIKIGSGEITNKPLLENLKKYKGLVILSTGMSTINEVERAVKILKKNKNKYHLLYCCSSYPTLNKDIDMNIMILLKKKFKCGVGFSDHTLGNEAAIASTILGSTYVEKHFTINKNSNGPDHAASFDFKDMKKLVVELKKYKSLLKSGKKIILNSEKENRINSRKSLVASRYIKKGEKFTKKNITTKRPGDGISPFDIDKVLKLKAKKNFFYDEKIKI